MIQLHIRAVSFFLTAQSRRYDVSPTADDGATADNNAPLLKPARFLTWMPPRAMLRMVLLFAAQELLILRRHASAFAFAYFFSSGIAADMRGTALKHRRRIFD